MGKKLTTVFFGSGPVALKSLHLLSEYVDLEAIVTKPSTQADMERGFPGTPVLAVQKRAELDKLCMQQNFHSQFGILIDFGVIVDQKAIDSFPLGIINSHFSLLPELRGVDPITFAILSGQAQTGVSLMLLVRAWDEGPLLAQAPLAIEPGTTALSLTNELVELSDQMLRQILSDYVAGRLIAVPQESGSILGSNISPTYTRKLTKEDGAIDWHKPAAQLEREIRAYIGWPRSYTRLAGKDVIIHAARVAPLHGAPGSVHVEHKQLFVCCSDHALEILEIQPAGKAKMPANAFLAGYGKLLNT
jgi:methionyl-tRNA formyltransferase